MYESIIKDVIPMLEGTGKGICQELAISLTEQESTLAEAEKSFFDRIPNLPRIGEDNPWIKSLIGVAYLSGLWRLLEEKGFKLGQISPVTQSALGQMTETALREQDIGSIGRYMCSPATISAIADRSQLKEYVEDWVCEAVTPQKNEDFISGINVYKCPIKLVLEQQGLLRYYPYFCLDDYPMHAAMGIDLQRTKTLAHGADCCDFRYKLLEKSQKLIIKVPEELKEFQQDKV